MLTQDLCELKEQRSRGDLAAEKALQAAKLACLECQEQTEKSDVGAVIIAPDYGSVRPGKGDETLRSQFHRYLVDAGVLPKSLARAQEHVHDLRKALRNAGADVCLLTDNATWKEVTESIQNQARRSRTLFIYFCGHGRPLHIAPSGTAHGVLDLVGTEKLFTEQVVEKLKSAQFGSEETRGTLVYIVNACCAGKPPVSPANSPQCDSHLSSNRTAHYDFVSVSSKSWGYSQSQDEGVEFGMKIIDIINAKPQIALKQWEEVLQGYVDCPKTLNNMCLFKDE